MPHRPALSRFPPLPPPPPFEHKPRPPPPCVCTPFCLSSSAVKYLHDKGITHRDMKLENILRSSSGPHKLCDFGSCVQVCADGCVSTSPHDADAFPFEACDGVPTLPHDASVSVLATHDCVAST